jgi:hypothetical protein
LAIGNWQDRPDILETKGLAALPLPSQPVRVRVRVGVGGSGEDNASPLWSAKSTSRAFCRPLCWLVQVSSKTCHVLLKAYKLPAFVGTVGWRKSPCGISSSYGVRRIARGTFCPGHEDSCAAACRMQTLRSTCTYS